MRGLVAHVPPSRPSRSKASLAGPHRLFAAGQTAMIMDGSWRVPALELANPTLDFAVAPTPRGRYPAVSIDSVLWGISAHSRHPEQAWEMIRWMTSPEQALRYWDSLRVAPPANISVVTGADFRETSGIRDAEGTVLSPGMEEAKFDDRAAWLRYAMQPHPETGLLPMYMNSTRYEPEVSVPLWRALTDALGPQRDRPAEELLARACGEIEAVIDRDRRARGLPDTTR